MLAALLAGLCSCAFNVPPVGALSAGDAADASVPDTGAADSGLPTDAASKPDAEAGDLDAEIADSLVDTGPDAGSVDTGPSFTPPTAQDFEARVNANISTDLKVPVDNPDRVAYTIRVVDPPAIGTAIGAADAITYQPPPNTDGTVQLQYVVNTSAGDSPRATLSLRIVDNRNCYFAMQTWGATAPSGLYALDPDGDGAGGAFEAYCEMNVDGGGWTMVARSVVDGQATAFGWSRSTGAAARDDAPYSLDLGAAGEGLQFSQMLVTSYSSAKTIDDAHKIFVSPAFVASCSNSPCARQGGSGLLGACGFVGVRSMLRNAGFTNLETSFWFSDSDQLDDQWGLHPSGFNMQYSDCRGAGLDGDQGMVFVRCDPQNVWCPLTRW